MSTLTLHLNPHFKADDMDALQFQTTEEATEVNIFHPKTNEPTEMFISVVSIESEIPSAKRRQYTDRRFAKLNKTRNGLKLTADEVEAEALDIIVACTKGWRGVGVGEPVTEFSAQKARELYTKVKAVREQVEDAINDRSLFTKTS